jgi:AbiV family abortive infection protein
MGASGQIRWSWIELGGQDAGMSSSPKPPLSPRELATFAQAALTNATELLSDAKVLLDAQRWPRAYALAVLAAEEYGKFHACVHATRLGPDSAENWNAFWKNLAWHGAKFDKWHAALVDIGHYGTLYQDWLEAWSTRDTFNQIALGGKLAALYVDFKDGVALEPRDVLTAEDAKRMVALVDKVIRTISELSGPLDTEVFERLSASARSAVSGGSGT